MLIVATGVLDSPSRASELEAVWWSFSLRSDVTPFCPASRYARGFHHCLGDGIPHFRWLKTYWWTISCCCWFSWRSEFWVSRVFVVFGELASV